jgi:cellulose synthase/poly-beta-1,6-N-acetylglucosamine synthase-like glycosyltransferase
VLSALWKSFFSICCFRSGPQDLPVSGELVFLSLLVYGLSSFVLALSSQPADIAVLSGLIDTVLLAGISYLLLSLWRQSERWLQTTLALSGTGVLFSIAALPFSYMFANSNETDPLVFLLFLFFISLLIWNITVMAHIMRHALSSSFALGVLVALFYVWMITSTITSLFPPQNL